MKIIGSIIRWIFNSSAFKKKQQANEIEKKLNEIIIFDRFEAKVFVNKTLKRESPNDSGIEASPPLIE